jgi:hypothetical protein
VKLKKIQVIEFEFVAFQQQIEPKLETKEKFEQHPLMMLEIVLCPRQIMSYFSRQFPKLDSPTDTPTKFSRCIGKDETRKRKVTNREKKIDWVEITINPRQQSHPTDPIPTISTKRLFHWANMIKSHQVDLSIN